MKCKYCGQEFDGGPYCPHCGSNNPKYVEPIKEEEPLETSKESLFEEQPKAATASQKEKPGKSRLLAAILAILFGTFGVQCFYLNRMGLGIVCILFAWTGIPSIIGFIEGLIILLENPKNFEIKYHCKNID